MRGHRLVGKVPVMWPRAAFGDRRWNGKQRPPRLTKTGAASAWRGAVGGQSPCLAVAKAALHVSLPVRQQLLGWGGSRGPFRRECLEGISLPAAPGPLLLSHTLGPRGLAVQPWDPRVPRGPERQLPRTQGTLSSRRAASTFIFSRLSLTSVSCGLPWPGVCIWGVCPFAQIGFHGDRFGKMDFRSDQIY